MSDRVTHPQQFGLKTKSPESKRAGNSTERCLKSILPIREGRLLADELWRGQESSVAPCIKGGYGKVLRLAPGEKECQESGEAYFTYLDKRLKPWRNTNCPWCEKWKFEDSSVRRNVFGATGVIHHAR